MQAKIIKLDYQKRLIALNTKEPFRFKLNDILEIKKLRRVRSNPQNSFLWVYYDYCIYNGLKEDHGYYSSIGLHENIKAYLKEKYPDKYKKDFSTTELSKQEFSEIFEIVNLEIMIEIFGIDTSGFFEEYEKFVEWKKYNIGTYRDYRLSKC